MSFRIKICYSEIYRKKLLSVNSERTYFTLVKCSTWNNASYGSKNIVRNLENENCVVTQHNIY